MRFRTSLLMFMLVAGFFTLPSIVHAGIPFFGPIIDGKILDQTCPLGWGAVIIIINNIISFLISVAIVFVAPLMIAWAGFLFVVNPVNAAGKEQAKKILLNTVVGIVIALAGWLIVDAIMAVLYHPSDSSWSTTWSDLITSDGTDKCLKQKGTSSSGTPDTPDQDTTPVVTDTGTAGKKLALCSDSNSACSPSFLQSVGFTTSQAKVMSCIAMTESSGNPTTCNGNACGTFQIMLSLNPLKGNACTGTTDCTGKSACYATNGKAKNASSPECKSCISKEKPSAQNATCNAQTAFYMFNKSGYSPWTCSGCNGKANTCKEQYGNA